MSIFTTPKTPDHSDELDKKALLDALAVFKVIEYDPETKTKFGTSPSVRAHVTVVDGDHAGEVEPKFFAAGNLARQIGEALEPGQLAPGRIRTGKSGNGKDWFGIEWATGDEDVARAEAALAGTPDTPTAPAPAPEPQDPEPAAAEAPAVPSWVRLAGLKARLAERDAEDPIPF